MIHPPLLPWLGTDGGAMRPLAPSMDQPGKEGGGGGAEAGTKTGPPNPGPLIGGYPPIRGPGPSGGPWTSPRAQNAFDSASMGCGMLAHPGTGDPAQNSGKRSRACRALVATCARRARNPPSRALHKRPERHARGRIIPVPGSASTVKSILCTWVHVGAHG